MEPATASRTAVLGVFNNCEDAQKAIQDLQQQGFTLHRIGMVSPDDGKIRNAERKADANKEADEVLEKAAGTIVGAGLAAAGTLAMSFGVIGDFGPVVTTGSLIEPLVKAAEGAAAGNLVSTLVGMGLTEEDAKFYAGELRQGKTLVTVEDEDHIAWKTLLRHGATRRDPSPELACVELDRDLG